MMMKDNREPGVLLAGYVLWAAVNLFRGFSVDTLPVIALFTLLAFTLNSPYFPFIFGSSLLALASPVLMPWAILTVSLPLCISGGSMRVRVTAFIAIASILWLVPVAFSIPLAIVAVLGAVTGKNRFKYLLLPAGFVFSAFLSGLPQPIEGNSTIAGSTIHSGTISYSIPEVNTSRTEVLLAAPNEGSWAVWIALEAGGVRDSIPLFAVSLGEEILLLPSGVDTVSVTMTPGDTLALTMMRDFKTFNHSVVHATAGGERL